MFTACKHQEPLLFFWSEYCNFWKWMLQSAPRVGNTAIKMKRSIKNIFCFFIIMQNNPHKIAIHKYQNNCFFYFLFRQMSPMTLKMSLVMVQAIKCIKKRPLGVHHGPVEDKSSTPQTFLLVLPAFFSTFGSASSRLNDRRACRTM